MKKMLGDICEQKCKLQAMQKEKSHYSFFLFTFLLPTAVKGYRIAVNYDVRLWSNNYLIRCVRNGR